MKNQVTFTYYGGMTVLARRSDGFQILFDPYIANNPHTNVPVSTFYDVDLVLVTHSAFDHMEDAGDIMAHSGAFMLCGNEVKRKLAAEGIDPARMSGTGYGDCREISGCVLHTVLAQHISISRLEGVHSSWPPYGFVVQILPGITYYHTGDTALYSDMKLIRELYHPQVMVAGIDGITPAYPCEMTPREAAMAVSWVGPEVVIPAHYPPGSPRLPEFLRHMQSFAPDVRIRPDIGAPFTSTPFTVV